MAGYYERRWTAKSPPILWDFGIAVLPVLENTRILEVFAAGFPALVFIRFAVLPGPFSMRWTILCRMFLLWGILWLLRGIMIISTVLPNPDQSCQPRFANPTNMFLEAFAILWSDTTCQDVLFSGHAALITLMVLVVMYYSALAPWPGCAASPSLVSWDFLFKSIAFISMVAGYYAIIASKFHYTVDVLVASIVTVLIFAVYHSTVHQVLKSQPQRFVPRFIVAFIRWFEGGSVDVALLNTTH